MGSQVKTPRFYVDMPSFLHAIGHLGWDNANNGGAELLYMNPSNPYTKTTDSFDTAYQVVSIGNPVNNTPKTSFPVNFCALLNHNLGSNNNDFNFYGKHGLTGSPTSVIFNPINQILNSNHNGTYINPYYNGTTIFDFESNDQYWKSFSIYYNSTHHIDIATHQLGSLVVGKYWDAPKTPDMSLTMSRRFDGIKKTKTIGGKTLVSSYYDGPTEWTMNNRTDGIYEYPPFELDLTTTDATDDYTFNARAKSGLGRKGLKSWKLTFSYISESDMFTYKESSNTLLGYTDINTMITDSSFNFVWNCTLGGTLPFIFQPNADQWDNSGVTPILTKAGDNSPDQFSICTFRGNTLSVKQQAHNVYKLSITIDEVA